MDAGNPGVRWSAYWLGRTMRFIGWFCRGIRFFWVTYGGAHFLLNAMALCVVVGTVILGYLAFEPMVPLRNAEIVRVEPETRIVDRDTADEFHVTRRICMEWAAWGNVSRSYVDAERDGLEFKMAVVQPVFLPGGCHERTSAVEVPPSLPPGRYLYRSVIQFCVRRGCTDAAVQDVPIVVRGAWPRQPKGPAALMHDPL